MTFRILALMGLALVLQACGTRPYIPTEYPLRDGLIPAFTASGNATFTNAQDSKSPAIVYSYVGVKLESNYHDITELMTTQAAKEFAKHGTISPGPEKTIALKVTSLESTYIAFFWKSKLRFEAQLGNGDVLQKDVAHTSGNVIQDLNGCIAESVLELFRDQRVMDYLTN